MKELSAEQFAQQAFDQRLLTEAQLQQVWAGFGTRHVDPDQFRQHLLGRELVTNYQVEKILRGHRSGYYYGDYKVLYLIGAGTFARVFRAVHSRTGEVVAVKVLRSRHSGDTALTEQFCREGEVGCSLRHPNIVPIYEVCAVGGAYFLVMEFVEGRNLREFVKVRKKFDPQQAVTLATDVAAGLDYAFQRGVTHRDLKMSNVLVSSRGRAKLVDFGLAALDEALIDDSLENVTNPRTIDYAGLERATGVRKGDNRSDIYFLGCMFYQMLTGRPPLVETRDKSQRLSKTRFEQVPPVAAVDPAVPAIAAIVVHKAMDLNPAARYQSPGEMHAELKVAFERLQDGGADGDAQAAESLLRQSVQRTVMIVESDTGIQDIFRDRFKKHGLRVLVTIDPARAVSRLVDDPGAADCVIFSTDNLNQPALDAFNQLAGDDRLKHIPAVLLLSQQHRDWAGRAQQADHRLVVPMPIRFGRLQSIVATLLDPVAAKEPTS